MWLISYIITITLPSSLLYYFMMQQVQEKIEDNKQTLKEGGAWLYHAG
jgi:hypothetical protein